MTTDTEALRAQPAAATTAPSDENGGRRLMEPDHETALALADAPRSLRNYVAALQAENERLRAERDDLLENGKQAVRWAPSSAHWSKELKRLFGDDAREGIDALEARLRAAQAERDALAAALEAAREDAARYRWLRKGAVDDVAVVRGLGATDYGMSAVVYTYSEEIDGDDLDAAIDAAIEDARPHQACFLLDGCQ